MKSIIFSFFVLIAFSSSILSHAQSGHAETLRNQYEGPQAKYIFLFIGDGMGTAHVNATEAYLSAQKNNKKLNTLNMSLLEVQSTMTTYSTDRFITGSAASGTAIATGYKTNTGIISMDESKTKSYKTIAEKAKENGYKVGILSSVPINHATPAVFYAHEAARHNYYNIGLQLPESGFDFFGGGNFRNPKGLNDNKKSLIEIAEGKGYTYLNDKKAIRKLDAGDEKVIAVNPRTSGGAMPYAIDMNRKDLTLAEFTGKAIEVLDNENGFFMMVEGGKIDWAGHANDAATIVHDMIDFDNAVAEALEFYEDHPDETLIIVTSDHETGGMSIGSRRAEYDSYFTKIDNQKVSQEVFADLLDEQKETLSFDEAMDMAKKHLGLGKRAGGFSLDEQDKKILKHAYEMEFGDKNALPEMDAMAASYTGNHPFASAATMLVNEKSGFSFTTNSHTAQAVPVKARGIGAELFGTYIDNTDISKNIEVLLIKK